MKNLTIAKALEIGFDFENSSSETMEELHKEIMDFLNENESILEQVEDECEVIGNGCSQHVSHGDFESCGEIINYGPEYWYQPADTKVFHSSYMFIEKDGMPKCMNLFQYVGENDRNTPTE